MGVILAIALDLASWNGAWSWVESSPPLLAVTLASMGLWLWGSLRARTGRAEGGATSHLRRQLGLWPLPAAAAPGAVVLPRSLADVLDPAQMRVRPRSPDPAGSSAPLRAPPEARPDSRPSQQMLAARGTGRGAVSLR